MTFKFNEWIVDVLPTLDAGVTLALNSGHVATLDVGIDAPEDLRDPYIEFAGNIIKRSGVTRFDNNLDPTVKNGPLIRYIFSARHNTPALELDMFINNGTLDNTKEDENNPLTPHLLSNGIFITTPKGYRWVSKVDTVKTQEIQIGDETVTTVLIEKAWLAQASLVWLGLYLVPNVLEESIVNDYRNNLPWADKVQPQWLGPSKSPTLKDTPIFADYYLAKVNSDFDKWNVNFSQAFIEGPEEIGSIPNMFIPQSLSYLVAANGQMTGGHGMGIDSLAQYYGLPAGKQWHMAANALVYSLCRPQRGFFNIDDDIASLDKVLAKIKSGDVEAPWESWNLSLGGTHKIFHNQHNPFGFTEPESGWEGMEGGIGKSGSVDLQHFSRAFGPAVFLAERFDDEVGKEAIRWFASTARLDIEDPRAAIGQDEKGWYSNLGRGYAFAAMINVYDWHFNKTEDAKKWAEWFIEACQTFQTNGMKDGNSGGSFCCWRTPQWSGSKEINWAKQVWADKNNYEGDLDALDPIPITGSYQEMLIFGALALAHYAGLDVSMDALNKQLGFLAEATETGDNTPAYRVNCITGENLSFAYEKGYTMSYYGCILSLLFDLPVSDAWKGVHYAEIFGGDMTVAERLHTRNPYGKPLNERNFVGLRALTEREDFPY
jgi:hypothetical protein